MVVAREAYTVGLEAHLGETMVAHMVVGTVASVACTADMTAAKVEDE